MATISVSATTSSITRTNLVLKKPIGFSSSPIVGLASMAKMGGGRVRCCMEEGKPSKEKNISKMGMVETSSCLLAAGAAMLSSPEAMALVDERMSTEGTGLPFGLSNNILGWILLGVFALIWALYFVYTSGLDEDEDSGLSL